MPLINSSSLCSSFYKIRKMQLRDELIKFKVLKLLAPIIPHKALTSQDVAELGSIDGKNRVEKVDLTGVEYCLDARTSSVSALLTVSTNQHCSASPAAVIQALGAAGEDPEENMLALMTMEQQVEEFLSKNRNNVVTLNDAPAGDVVTLNERTKVSLSAWSNSDTLVWNVWTKQQTSIDVEQQGREQRSYDLNIYVPLALVVPAEQDKGTKAQLVLLEDTHKQAQLLEVENNTSKGQLEDRI